MSQTIKGQMLNQILINQNLLNFQDTDSQISDEQQENKNLPLRITSHKQQNQNMFYSHQEMIKKRRQVLKQLSISPNKISKNSLNNAFKSQKPLHRQRSSQTDYNQIVDLKSKLAQVLKQSQEKSIKIQELQNQLLEITSNIQKQKQSLNQKQNLLNLKEIQIQKLNYQNFKLQEEYHTRIKQLQEQLNVTNRRPKIGSYCKQIMKSDGQNLFDKFKIQVELKNQLINQLRKNQEKVQKVIIQNKKLKKNVQRLLLLVEKCAKKEFSQNTKHISQKHNKKRSISHVPQIYKERKNTKSDYSSVKCSESTKQKQFNKSLISIKDKRTNTELSSYLQKQLQKFLRKWHVAQNNHKFIEGLVDLIHQFTEDCIDQHKAKAENRYKSLKKEMVRKANQSLNFNHIMKERQIQIKLNKNFNEQNQKIKSFKTQHQFNVKDQTLSSDNLSILVPASNKKQYENKNGRLLSVSLLEDKNIKKQEISYNNLEKSIRLHKKLSTNQIIPKTDQNYFISEKIESIFNQQNKKKSHQKSKTQISIRSKKLENSTNNKRTKSQYKDSTFL